MMKMNRTAVATVVLLAALAVWASASAQPLSTGVWRSYEEADEMEGTSSWHAFVDAEGSTTRSRVTLIVWPDGDNIGDFYVAFTGYVSDKPAWRFTDGLAFDYRFDDKPMRSWNMRCTDVICVMEVGALWETQCRDGAVLRLRLFNEAGEQAGPVYKFSLDGFTAAVADAAAGR